MGLFDRLVPKSPGPGLLAARIRQHYGESQVCPQMWCVDALVASASRITDEQIYVLDSNSNKQALSSVGHDEAFNAVFSAAIASGRLDAVILVQDYVAELVERHIRRLLGSQRSEASVVPQIALRTITALYVRDWIDREITDTEISKFSKPPYFVISSRRMTRDDYLIVTKSWRTVIEKIHPDDQDV